METIQIVLDNEYTVAADLAARRFEMNQLADWCARRCASSAAAGDEGSEARDREGYAKNPAWSVQKLRYGRQRRRRSYSKGRCAAGSVRLPRTKSRPVFVLTRDSAIGYLATVTGAANHLEDDSRTSSESMYAPKTRMKAPAR